MFGLAVRVDGVVLRELAKVRSILPHKIENWNSVQELNLILIL